MTYGARHFWDVSDLGVWTYGLIDCGNHMYATRPFSSPTDPDTQFQVVIKANSPHSVHLQFADGCLPAANLSMTFRMKVENSYDRTLLDQAIMGLFLNFLNKLFVTKYFCIHRRLQAQPVSWV